MTRMPISATEQAVAHLDARTWAAANTRMVTKMISEFSHELLITPIKEAGADNVFMLSLDHGVRYRFAARVLELEH